jgi:hypothetical protein
MKSSIKSLFPLFVLIFIVLGCNRMTEQERIKYEERKKVVEKLNEQFDLSNKPRTPYQVANGIKFDCDFKFRMEYGKDKVLVARHCESTSQATKEAKLTPILTPGNLDLIKNSGFEIIELFDRTEDKLIVNTRIQ